MLSSSLPAAMSEPVRFHAVLSAKAHPCDTCPARALSICAAMRIEDLGRLATARVTQRVEAGATFIDESEPADHYFNITAEAVKVYKLLADGRRQITGFLFAGDLLGIAFKGGYAYSAEALTSLSVCRFPRRQSDLLIDVFLMMEKRWLPMACNELASAQEQMMLLGRKTAHERIASFLLTSSDRHEWHGCSSDRPQLPMTRCDIA